MGVLLVLGMWLESNGPLLGFGLHLMTVVHLHETLMVKAVGDLESNGPRLVSKRLPFGNHGTKIFALQVPVDVVVFGRLSTVCTRPSLNIPPYI